MPLRIQGKGPDKDSCAGCCRGSSYQSCCEEGMQGHAQQIGQDRHAEEGYDNGPVKAEPFPVVSIRNSKPGIKKEYPCIQESDHKIDISFILTDEFNSRCNHADAEKYRIVEINKAVPGFTFPPVLNNVIELDNVGEEQADNCNKNKGRSP